MLNIYELTSQYLNTDYLYGKSFRKAFLGFMGINPNARLYPLTELELMSFCLGTISSRELYSIGFPYKYDPDDEYVLQRLLSRKKKEGYFEIYQRSEKDNGICKYYGLTEKGYEKVEKYLISKGIANKYPLRRTCFHEYALGMALLSLIKSGMEFQFETEQQNSIAGAFMPNGKGNGYIISDAILKFDNGKTFYVEQDMGTEGIGVLVNKIAKYRESDKDIIFSFHKATNGKMPKTSHVMKIAELSNEYETVNDVVTAIRKRKMRNSTELRDTMNALSAVSGTNVLAEMINYATANKNKVKELYRAAEIINYADVRGINLYRAFYNSDHVSMAKNGMNIYFVSSEYMSTSSAFYSYRERMKIVEDIVGRENILCFKDKGVYKYGVRFQTCAHMTNGAYVFMEHSDNVGGIIRMVEAAYDLCKSNDKLIITVKSSNIEYKIRKMLETRKIKYKDNIILHYV